MKHCKQRSLLGIGATIHRTVFDAGETRRYIFRQVKFPRSRKHRIRKKWAKRVENYAVVSKQVDRDLSLQSPLVNLLKGKALVVDMRIERGGK